MTEPTEDDADDDEGTRTVCDTCGYEWTYGGGMNHSTTCPDCRNKTTIGVSEDQTADSEV